MIQMKVKKLYETAKLPTKAYEGDSCWDVYATGYDPIILSNSWGEIHTGIIIELPKGYGLQIRPRSSITNRNLFMHWGTIDNGYRGELTIFLFNMSDYNVFIEAHEKIAQVFIEKIVEAKVVEVNKVSETERGTKGFGSSGK